jgi:hypothetical protein
VVPGLAAPGLTLGTLQRVKTLHRNTQYQEAASPSEERCQYILTRLLVIIKRLIQAHMGQSKSDKKGAKLIMRYGQQQELNIWQPDEVFLVECRQLEQVIEELIK